jgi:membrane-bound metal-dependent hydrolase YbcI (DUF457 family)
MNPITHLLVSWTVANADGLNRRERAMVTLAGIAPDLDGLGVIPEYLTRHSAHPLAWWSDYHHVLTHNLWFGLAAALIGFALATRRWTTALLALVAFHLHLLADLVGARGPEGEQWPILYLYPLSHSGLTWSGQWALNAWPNFVITGLALALTLYLAWKRGYSPLELISTRADRALTATLRQRFPLPPQPNR